MHGIFECLQVRGQQVFGAREKHELTVRRTRGGEFLQAIAGGERVPVTGDAQQGPVAAHRRQVVDTDRRSERDERPDFVALLAHGETNPAPEREPASENRLAGMPGQQLRERRARVGAFSRATAVMAGARADAAELEAQHRQTRTHDAARRMVDGLGVHGAAMARVRMTQQRRTGARAVRHHPQSLERARRPGDADRFDAPVHGVGPRVSRRGIVHAGDAMNVATTTGPGPDAAQVRAARAYCRAVLPRVSRTFALNIRLLRGDLGEAVRCAYLFCRIADTLEDSPRLDAGERGVLLREYRSLFPLGRGGMARAARWSERFAAPAADAADDDWALCAAAPQVFTAFAVLPPALRGPVEDCVQEMAAGMSEFAARRVAAPDGRLRLDTLADLERYCHYVAGTVGFMLCRLFAATSPRLDADRVQRMRELAGRFGLAMQLTNIVKDIGEDARRGAFFVPRVLAARHRLRPDDLMDPARRDDARAVLGELVAQAVRALDEAVAFTLLIPRRETRLRLFCLWPLFLAVRTLRRVQEDERALVPGARVRMSRAAVRRCLASTTAVVLSNGGIRWLYARERRRLELQPSRP